MALALFCCFSLTFAYQQLLPLSYSHTFHAGDPILLFLSSSSQLCSAAHALSYSLTSWFRFTQYPATPQELFLLESSPGLPAVQGLLETDGRVTFKVYTCSDMYTLGLPGLNTNMWVHIAVSVIAYTQAIASLVSWTGMQLSPTQGTSNSFRQYDPLSSQITLGGASIAIDNAEMVDFRFYDTSLTALQIKAEAGPGICPIECCSICEGPDIKSCYFYPFIGRNDVFPLNSSPNAYMIPSQRIEANYATTGWYYFTQTGDVGTKSLFRLSNTLTDSGNVGDRVMLIVLKTSPSPNTLELSFDTTIMLNPVTAQIDLPVIST